MANLIESLEQRTLLSVTTATLTADLAKIVTDSAATRGALNALFSGIRADSKTIASDIKTGANTRANRALLAHDKIDEAIIAARLRASDAVFLAVSNALARRDKATGVAVINHPTVTRLKTILSNQITSMETTVSNRLTALNTVSNNSGTTFNTDLTNLVNANSGNATIVNAAHTASVDAQNFANTFSNDAAAVQADVNALGSDLQTLTT